MRNLPRDSATARSALGDDASWDLTAHLLASLIDLLAVANWQRSGGKGARPKRVPRPGATASSERRGNTDRSPQEAVRYLAQFRPAEGGD